MSDRTRSIAFYLPEFHPIPENDQWPGEGAHVEPCQSWARSCLEAHRRAVATASLSAAG